MLKQQDISITCGTIYSDLFESDYFFSSLDHSIAVALIIWHFTHDKKQTLSGLFHDLGMAAGTFDADGISINPGVKLDFVNNGLHFLSVIAAATN